MKFIQIKQLTTWAGSGFGAAWPLITLVGGALSAPWLLVSPLLRVAPFKRRICFGADGLTVVKRQSSNLQDNAWRNFNFESA